MTYDIRQADALDFLRAQEQGSLDLVFGSPPYEMARLYLENGKNLGIARDTEGWVAWMVQVFKAALRACKGLVAFVVEGQTKDFRYSCGPALLMADLHRAGVCLRKPPIFHRVGIPGSGGPDWWRNDYEFIICATNGGKLPWSDNTATGHPPKWAPGGEMSHRITSGQRVNQLGHFGDGPSCVAMQADGERDKRKRPSHRITNGRDQWGGTPTRTSGEGRNADGEHKGRRVPAGTTVDGELLTEDAYFPPTLANPGNSIEQTYKAAEVAELLQADADWIHCNVGGGVMGESDLCHENEAPFPESLVEPFVLSFCPPGGTVCDPFSGSGTVAAVSVRHGRNFVGCDLRQSQVDIALRRVAGETPLALMGDSNA